MWESGNRALMCPKCLLIVILTLHHDPRAHLCLSSQNGMFHGGILSSECQVSVFRFPCCEGRQAEQQQSGPRVSRHAPGHVPV